MEEGTFLLSGDPLRGSSRAFMGISVGYPQNGVRIAKTANLHNEADENAVGMSLTHSRVTNCRGLINPSD
jgi:hypothetical protein